MDGSGMFGWFGKDFELLIELLVIVDAVGMVREGVECGE